MSEVRSGWADRFLRWTTTGCVLVLAGIAAVISYKHMFVLVRRYGEASWTAALLPVSVDGMIVASSMSLLADSRLGRRSGLLPWALLVIGSAASLAANVAVAEPSVVGRLIAAWPSCALIGSYELLMRQIRHAAARPVPGVSYGPLTRPTAGEAASYEGSFDVAGEPGASDASHTGVTWEGAASYEPSYAAHTSPGDRLPVSYGVHTHDAGSLMHRADDVESENVQRWESAHSRRRRPASGLQSRAWQWALANRTPTGELPSGKTIAERFGRRERWGRLVKQAGVTGQLDAIAS